MEQDTEQYVSSL